MRRITIIATALIVLGVAATAYAATQPYTGTVAFSNQKAGTAKKPNPVKYTLDLKAGPTTGGNRPPIQLDIKLRIYGLKVDGTHFPTCALSKIAAAHNDTVCPPKARVASGYITSLLGSATDLTATGAECDPALDVWNSGQGKLTFFFVTSAQHSCLGGALKTGATPPYPGTYKMQGKYFVSDVPVPKYIDFPVPGLVGSLKSEHLVFTTQTMGSGKNKHTSQASVGCLNGKRPYQIITTQTNSPSGTPTSSSTISSTAPC